MRVQKEKNETKQNETIVTNVKIRKSLKKMKLF